MAEATGLIQGAPSMLQSRVAALPATLPASPARGQTKLRPGRLRLLLPPTEGDWGGSLSQEPPVCDSSPSARPQEPRGEVAGRGGPGCRGHTVPVPARPSPGHPPLPSAGRRLRIWKPRPRALSSSAQALGLMDGRRHYTCPHPGPATHFWTRPPWRGRHQEHRSELRGPSLAGRGKASETGALQTLPALSPAALDLNINGHGEEAGTCVSPVAPHSDTPSCLERQWATVSETPALLARVSGPKCGSIKTVFPRTPEPQGQPRPANPCAEDLGAEAGLPSGEVDQAWPRPQTNTRVQTPRRCGPACLGDPARTAPAGWSLRTEVAPATGRSRPPPAGPRPPSLLRLGACVLGSPRRAEANAESSSQGPCAPAPGPPARRGASVFQEESRRGPRRAGRGRAAPAARRAPPPHPCTCRGPRAGGARRPLVRPAGSHRGPAGRPADAGRKRGAGRRCPGAAGASKRADDARVLSVPEGVAGGPSAPRSAFAGQARPLLAAPCSRRERQRRECLEEPSLPPGFPTPAVPGPGREPGHRQVGPPVKNSTRGFLASAFSPARGPGPAQRARCSAVAGGGTGKRPGTQHRPSPRVTGTDEWDVSLPPPAGHKVLPSRPPPGRPGSCALGGDVELEAGAGRAGLPEGCTGEGQRRELGARHLCLPRPEAILGRR
ncbi:PREDICTED: nascent polypeptide-associated complex subunit alpha, muscle-specific form-like [Chinchilla lanigera]|uniref:nascent polypeptide-associated complex subunit alpha, muscle-specific form-like n=1 Tax=Chinchilla lanigera TaxID=34839 RepID=UPI0006962FDF|nr:PREDICTED: nascent polypeptide-associated complex subunit alpha, muscle-specific form-like [Chinchilla lanigera]